MYQKGLLQGVCLAANGDARVSVIGLHIIRNTVVEVEASKPFSRRVEAELRNNAGYTRVEAYAGESYCPIQAQY